MLATPRRLLSCTATVGPSSNIVLLEHRFIT
jgi:hypothetical protein